jgi:hypothetical protein
MKEGKDDVIKNKGQSQDEDEDVDAEQGTWEGKRLDGEGSAQGVGEEGGVHSEGISSTQAALYEGGVLRYSIVTAALLICNVSMAMIFSDLGFALSIVGATGSTLVILILPGSFYFFKKEKEIESAESEVDHTVDGERGRSGSGVSLLGPVSFSSSSSSSCSYTSVPSSSSQVAKNNLLAKSFAAPTASSSFRPSRPIDPLWKRYLALGMLGLGLVTMPVCLFIIFDFA